MVGSRSLGWDDQGNTVDRRSCLGGILRYDLPQLRAGPCLRASLRAGQGRHATRRRRLRLSEDAAETDHP
jgi:hypothetical protein